MTEKFALYSKYYIDGVGYGKAQKHTSPIPKATATKLVSKYNKIWNEHNAKGVNVKVFIRKVRK